MPPMGLQEPAGSVQPRLLWESRQDGGGSESYGYKTGTVLFSFHLTKWIFTRLLSSHFAKEGQGRNFCSAPYSGILLLLPDGHVRTLILSSHSPVQARGPPFLGRKALAMLSGRRGNVPVKNQSG